MAWQLLKGCDDSGHHAVRVYSPESFQCTWMSLARRNGAVNVSQRSPSCSCFKWRKTSPHAQTASIQKIDGMLTRLAKHVTQGTKKKSESLRIVGPGHAEKKWSKPPGRGRVPKWTLCSQVLLFSGKSGTLLQQYVIGMRKVSGFPLFSIKSHRVCQGFHFIGGPFFSS